MLGFWTGGVLEGEADNRSSALPLRVKAAIPRCEEICPAAPAQSRGGPADHHAQLYWRCHTENSMAARLVSVAASGPEQQCSGMRAGIPTWVGRVPGECGDVAALR